MEFELEDNQEIYQYFISDCSKEEVEYLMSSFSDVYFTYSDKLDLWILCVTHFGTMWTNVEVDILNPNISLISVED